MFSMRHKVASSAFYLHLRTFKKVFNGSISVFFITKGYSNVAHQFSILGDKVLLEYHLCRLLRATKAGWRVYKVNKVLTLIVCKNCRTAIGHWRQYTVIALISKIYFSHPVTTDSHYLLRDTKWRSRGVSTITGVDSVLLFQIIKNCT